LGEGVGLSGLIAGGSHRIPGDSKMSDTETVNKHSANQCDERSGAGDAFSEAVREIFEDIKRAVKYYNYRKPRSSYVSMPRIKVYRSRRTGKDNLFLFKFYIPQTKPAKPGEVVVIAVYRSFERPASKKTFKRFLEYIWKRLEEFEREDAGFWKHRFIYFVAEGFRAGAEELRKRVNKDFKERGEDTRIRFVKVNPEPAIVVSTVRRDIVKFLGSRAWRYIWKLNSGSAEGNNADRKSVKGAKKHFLDFIMLVLSRLLDQKAYLDAQDVAARDEVLLSVYTNFLHEKLRVEPPKPKQEKKTEKQTKRAEKSGPKEPAELPADLLLARPEDPDRYERV